MLVGAVEKAINRNILAFSTLCGYSVCIIICSAFFFQFLTSRSAGIHSILVANRQDNYSDTRVRLAKTRGYEMIIDENLI